MRGGPKLVRKWEIGDIPQLKEMADRQGHFFTDPRDARNALTFVALDDKGVIIASLTGRITSEIMLCVNPDSKQRFTVSAAILALTRRVMDALWKFGIADAHAPVKPGLNRFKKAAVRSAGFTEDNRMHLLFDIREYMARETK